MKIKTIIIFFALLSAKYCWVQDFRLMRYDEDHSSLKDSVRNFYNRIKYIPLASTGNVYLSFGGEARAELDYAANEDWGKMNVGADVFLLQRYHLHADLKLGNRIRVFGQLRSGLEDGRKQGPRGIDEDQLNVQNLFLDMAVYKKRDRALLLRAGRQELRYGSGRLIDVRDGPNLRLYFDGVKLTYQSSNLSVDAFVMADAVVRNGIFDNTSTRRPSLWGMYSTYISPKQNHFDLYYLGINRVNAVFDDGIADELRHTVGARVSKDGDGFIYNFEAIYQFGTFGTAKIGALGISSEIGYKFKHAKGRPIVKFRKDYIPGDKTKDDNRLGTSNGLCPNGGYFGMNPQAGPANLLSLHPALTWQPNPNLTHAVDVIFNWRHSLSDGVYGPAGFFRLSSSGSKERYIGTAYMTTLSWKINKFLSYSVGVQYFRTGSFINDVIPQHKDGFFVTSLLGFKF